MIGRLAAWVLTIFVIHVTAAVGEAASTRLTLERCAYVSCFPQPKFEEPNYSFKRSTVGSAKVLRRQTEDTVSRLQNKISRDQARHKQLVIKDRPSYPYSNRYSPSWYDSRLSCPQGQRFVLGEGFSRVYALDCQGRTFTYLAWQSGERVLVTVDPLFGGIISTRHY
jgi:hypothetical protein